MENSFSSRFKSRMKIEKNSSIFDTLIPIEKKLKEYQLHNEISLSSKRRKPTKCNKIKIIQRENPCIEEKNDKPLPPIIVTESSKSHSRILSNRNKNYEYGDYPYTPEYLSSMNKAYSPSHFKSKFVFHKKNPRLIRSFDSKN